MNRKQRPGNDRPAEGSWAARLYRDHFGWLVRVLGARFGRQRAEDLAQDVYLRVALSEPQDIQHPKSYLMHVARNAYVDSLRHRAAQKRGQAMVMELELVAEPGCEPDQDQALLLRQVILSMPPHLREVFLLNRVAGLSYAEIADKLGLSVKAIEKRMSQALAHCVSQLRS